MAPNAFFRPCHSRSRSASLAAVRTERAPDARSNPATVSVSARTPFSLRPSSSTSRMAAECRGYDAGGDDRRDTLAGRAQAREIGQQGADGVRHRCEPDGDARRDSEVAFRADEQADEIGPPWFAAGTADLDKTTVRQKQLEPEDVIGRDAVLETVRAARVFGDVAAENA